MFEKKYLDFTEYEKVQDIVDAMNFWSINRSIVEIKELTLGEVKQRLRNKELYPSLDNLTLIGDDGNKVTDIAKALGLKGVEEEGPKFKRNSGIGRKIGIGVVVILIIGVIAWGVYAVSSNSEDNRGR